MATDIPKLSPTQRFTRLLNLDKKALVNLYVFAFFAAIVSLSLPLGIQAIINLISSGQVTTSFYVLILIVIVGYGLTGYLQILQISVCEVLQRKVFAGVAFDFAIRAPRFRMSALRNVHTPELMNRFFDTLTIQKGIPKILIDFAGSSLQIIIGLILLCFYHPFFILFGFLSLLLVFFIVRILSPQGLRTALQQSKYKYEVAHWLEELARTVETFKLAGTTELPLKHADKTTLNYLDARESHFRSLLFHYYSILLFKVIIAGAFLLLGGLLVIEQQMNIGQFVAAEIIIILMLSNVEKLIFSLDAIYDMLTALEKLGNVTDIELENEGAMDLPLKEAGGMQVVASNLTYTVEKENVLLKNVNFEIQDGERVLITGYSGSGKHTLLQLLNGFYLEYEGAIRMNGASIKSLNLQKMRDSIGDSLSTDAIFKGTFLENITLGEDKSMDEVLRIIDIARLRGFLDRLEEGLLTELIPEGKRLSRSNIAKILLARCLIKKPKLLLIDDNIDLIREDEKNAILDYIFEKQNLWTVIMVNNVITRGETYDKIICMKDGEIIDQGSPSEVRDKIWYQELKR